MYFFCDTKIKWSAIFKKNVYKYIIKAAISLLQLIIPQLVSVNPWAVFKAQQVRTAGLKRRLNESSTRQ